MKVSIIIPFRNDHDELPKTLGCLLQTDNIEVIIVNDGSVEHSGRFKPLVIDDPRVIVINNPVSFGVGYSFDRGVEIASNDTIILMGVDVTPHEGWYEKVIEAVNSKPESIGCAVCVGDKEPHHKYYGAEMLLTYGNDDLPPKSELRKRKGGFTDLFRGRWADKKGDEPYEISCIMGAFYFTSKSWYQHIGGFDTVIKNRFCGHRFWGHLEPYISLKSWLVGGGCTLYPEIEATHIFNRAGRDSKHSKGARSAEWMWWNAIFILETQIMSQYTRNRLYDFVKPELNFNVAKHMIRNNYKTIERVREANRLKFKNELSWYIEKFSLNPIL